MNTMNGISRRWSWIVRVYLGIWFRHKDGKLSMRTGKRW